MLVRVLEVTTFASMIKFEQTFGGCLGHGQGAYLILSMSERFDILHSSRLSRCRGWVVLRTSLLHV